MKRNVVKFSFITFLIVCLALMAGGCSPTEGSSSTKKDDVQELINDVYHDGVFVFEELAWSSPEEEIVKRKKLEDGKDEVGNYIKKDEAFAMEKGSLEKSAVYVMSDGQFVSGEYLISTTDRELFTDFVNDLREAAAESLPEPMGNSLEDLKQVESFPTVLWEAEDGSSLKIAVMDVGNQEEYWLQVKSSSPLLGKESLAP